MKPRKGRRGIMEGVGGGGGEESDEENGKK